MFINHTQPLSISLPHSANYTISMDSKPSSLATPLLIKETLNPQSTPNNKDFLNHVEAYLAKRDGVDKLLKIFRYTAKIILASSALPETLTLTQRLKSFESSVGVSRKAFRLGKFIQDVNAFRNSHLDSKEDLALSLVAYGGEGLYFFVEQFVWLVKSGLIDKKHARRLGLISAWAELVGYVGSVALKIRDLNLILEEEKRVKMSIEIAITRGLKIEEEKMRLGKLVHKKMMKRLSVVQDLADAVMAVADIRDGKGHFLGPLSVSIAGLLSALISTHKNWVSC